MGWHGDPELRFTAIVGATVTGLGEASDREEGGNQEDEKTEAR